MKAEHDRISTDQETSGNSFFREFSVLKEKLYFSFQDRDFFEVFAGFDNKRY